MNELVIESLEALDAFDTDLLAIESATANPEEPLRNAFRRIHTIKGSSACLGLTPIESLAHVAENLLSLMRDGKMAVTPSLVSNLLRTADRLRNMMHDLDRQGSCDGYDNRDLIELLNATATRRDSAEPARYGFFDPLPADGDAGAAGAAPGYREGQEWSAAPAAGEAFGLFEPLAMPAAERPAVREEAAAADDGAGRLSASESAIRVDVRYIDRLMNLVGELVLARNHIVQYAASHQDAVLQGSVQRVNHITTELQESVMKTRMQPIGNIWAKFPRVVRDVSQELGKQVRLVMEGSETELDRAVVEAIKDPLMHVLRNAMDHGIERPEDRLKAGKAAEGRLTLRAYHEGGQVIIEVSDDGRGIATAKVLKKATEAGLVTAAQAEKLTEGEIFALIFLPGFSTAERVTSISGRGVGMDVVRSNIEKIGGTVDLRSAAGAGTTLRIKIPLTLAIIPALVIGCAGERFAIPQASLVELVGLANQRQAVEGVQGRPVLRLRGRLLPLVYLAETLFGHPARTGSYIVVLQAEGQQFGLVVDDIRDTEEIVVKPLGKELKDVGTYAGATIMGDGRVALILDIFAIARETGVLKPDAAEAKQSGDAAANDSNGARQSLLLVRCGGNRLAIPMEGVTRLEEIPRNRLERAGREPVLQYRGSIMRVADLGETLGLGPAPDSAALNIVVCRAGAGAAGLIVEAIEDIVEEAVDLRRSRQHRGLAGAGVVRGQVTDFVDLAEVAALSGIRTEEAA